MKQQLESLTHDGPSERDIFSVLPIIISILYREYSPLDVLIKLCADEKMEGIGIYRYSTLWEIMDRTGLLDKRHI